MTSIIEEKEYTEKRFLEKYAPKGISTLSREVISKHTRDGMKRARAECKWQGGHPPDGFNLDDKKKLLQNERALLIKSMFLKYNEMENTPQIAFDLNKQGIKTRNDKNWTALKIYRILTNPIYKGTYKSKETEIYVSDYQIVSTELFDRVQKKLKKRGPHKKMPKERKEDGINRMFNDYFKALERIESPTERAIEFKPELEIDKESIFFPREDESVLTKTEKIRLRVLIHLEEICKILETMKEIEILDRKSAENIQTATNKLNKMFKETILAHPEKRQIIEGSIEKEKERITTLAIERRQFLDEVVGDSW